MPLPKSINFVSEKFQISDDLKMKLTFTFALISSIICLVIVFWKLKLNCYIKSILIIMISIIILCSITFLISNFLKSYYLKCYFSSNAVIFLMATFPMGALISLLRYYSAHLASKTKIIQRYSAIPIIIFGTFVSFFSPFGINLNDAMGYNSLLAHCHEKETLLPSNPIVPLIIAPIQILTLILGLLSDVKMYLFVRKRHNQINDGSTLVPWKKSSQNEKEDLEIPIRATIISTILMIISSIIIGSLLVSVYGDLTTESFSWILCLLGNSAAICPVVLVTFTFKRQKGIKPIPQPPQGLHFHESPDQHHSNELQFHHEENNFELAVHM